MGLCFGASNPNLCFILAFEKGDSPKADGVPTI